MWDKIIEIYYHAVAFLMLLDCIYLREKDFDRYIYHLFLDTNQIIYEWKIKNNYNNVNWLDCMIKQRANKNKTSYDTFYSMIPKVKSCNNHVSCQWITSEI